MEKLAKLKTYLSSQGFVNVDGIIASCAAAMLTEQARKSAASIMDSWTIEELKSAADCIHKSVDNGVKPAYTKPHKR